MFNQFNRYFKQIAYNNKYKERFCKFYFVVYQSQYWYFFNQESEN